VTRQNTRHNHSNNMATKKSTTKETELVIKHMAIAADNIDYDDADLLKKIQEITSDFLPNVTKPTPVRNFYVFDATKDSFVSPVDGGSNIFMPHTIEDLTNRETLIKLVNDAIKEKSDAQMLYTLFKDGIVKQVTDASKVTFKDTYIKDKEKKKYYAFDTKEGRAQLADGIVIKAAVSRAFKTTEITCDHLNKQRAALLKILHVDQEEEKVETDKKDKKKKEKKEKKEKKKKDKKKKDKKHKKEKRKRDDQPEEEKEERLTKKVKLDVLPPQPEPEIEVIDDKTEIKTTSKKAKDEQKEKYIVLNTWYNELLKEKKLI
jgi:hypothetical protein